MGEFAESKIGKINDFEFSFLLRVPPAIDIFGTCNVFAFCGGFSFTADSDSLRGVLLKIFGLCFMKYSEARLKWPIFDTFNVDPNIPADPAAVPSSSTAIV